MKIETNHAAKSEHETASESAKTETGVADEIKTETKTAEPEAAPVKAKPVTKEEFLAATDAIDEIDAKIKEHNKERIEHNKVLRRYLGRRA